eukprot:gene9734-13100_t
MDRTFDLISIADDADNSWRLHSSNYILTAPSPFIMQSSDLVNRIRSFRKLLVNNYESYVNYHRYLPINGKIKLPQKMSNKDRHSLNQEMILFVASVASEIQDLNHTADESNQSSLTANASVMEFYKQIINFLSNELNVFTKLMDKMQKEYKKSSISPFRLLSNKYSNDQLALSKSLLENDDNYANNNNNNNNQPIIITTAVSNNHFARRYLDEIAPSGKMNEYDQIAVKHKDILLKESRMLHNKFSEDIQQSHKLEETVTSISGLIVEFVSMIESQSAIVTDIGDHTKEVTKMVEDADSELILTLERSQAHSQSMIILISGLAIVLLLLDYLTP